MGFGMRQLVDIAARALSPGVNDPTTAIQVIDQLHDLLRRLATRPLLPRQFLVNRGHDAVHIPQPTFADYLDLAVGEIAHWGRGDQRVERRLQVMFYDLQQAAQPPQHDDLVRARARYDVKRTVDDGPRAVPPSDVGLRS